MRGDYKHGKVKDPTAKLEPKHERTVKKFVKDFLDKAVQKKAQRDKEASQDGAKAESHLEKIKKSDSESPLTPDLKTEMEDVLASPSNDEILDSQQGTPTGSSTSELKRKREDDASGSEKKTKTDVLEPPPPPPPPPTGDMPVDGEGIVYAAVEDMGKAASPMQLATPPTTLTNGSCEHDGEGTDQSTPQAQLMNGVS